MDPKSHTYRILCENMDLIMNKIMEKIDNIIYQRRLDIQKQDIKLGREESFLGSQVISLSLQKAALKTCMKYLVDNQRDYLICLKSDGMRYLLVFTSKGNCYLVSRKMQIFRADVGVSHLVMRSSTETERIVSIFDGELIRNPGSQSDFHFQLFDCVLYNNVLKVEENYTERIKICEDLLLKNYFLSHFGETKQTNIKCYVKDFYEVSEIAFLLKKIQNISLYKDKIDGLIFTRIHFPYLPGKSCGILKWKPDSLNSIDFLLVENRRYIEMFPDLFNHDDFFVFELYTIHSSKFAFFDFYFVFNTEDFLSIQQSFKKICLFGREFQGIIVECNYDKNINGDKMGDFYQKVFAYDSEQIETLLRSCFFSDFLTTDPYQKVQLFLSLENRYDIQKKTYGGNWKIMRTRGDKDAPNGFTTAKNVFMTLFQENISEDFLIEKLKEKR